MGVRVIASVETMMSDEAEKATDTRALEEQVAALMADLESLRSDVAGLAQASGAYASKRANGAYHAARETAGEAYDEARETAAEALKAAQARLDALSRQAESWTNDNMGNLRETVKEQPLMAVALAVSAGALLGALLLRR
ncbi:MAG: DUF883 family protein [Alphaproteobacteria bacterium]|nr:DUF883 family protein [Alphaproteobacteria bacterium]